MRKKTLLTALFIIFIELAVGVLVIIAFLSLLLEISRNNLMIFDRTVIDFIYSFRSEAFTEIMKFITFLGGEIFLVSGILLLLALVYRKHKISSFNFTVLLVFGTVINLLLKFIYQRPRPDYLPLMFESTYSFPSGHAMNSFIFYSCIAYFIFRNTTSTKIKVISGLLLGVLVFMIGISRIYLGVHYPSDVLAGFVAGMLWFAVIVLVEKTARKFKLFK